MAKKASKKKKTASSANRVGAPRGQRKEEYTSERMLTVVERMREQAARLSALARAMDDAGVEEILVDGHAMLLRGLNQVDNFTDNSSRAVREAKTSLQEH